MYSTKCGVQCIFAVSVGNSTGHDDLWSDLLSLPLSLTRHNPASRPAGCLGTFCSFHLSGHGRELTQTQNNCEQTSTFHRWYRHACSKHTKVNCVSCSLVVYHYTAENSGQVVIMKLFLPSMQPPTSLVDNFKQILRALSSCYLCQLWCRILKSGPDQGQAGP